MNISAIAVWPIRRLALRLYRPYIEAADAISAHASVEGPLRDADRRRAAVIRFVPESPDSYNALGRHRSRALGTLIREHRESAGYSRFRVGELLGISPTQIERWELDGVPTPPSERVLTLTDLLAIPDEAIETALSQENRKTARPSPRSRSDDYGAIPALEYAIEFHGWSPDEVAQALDTSPTKVQAWRLGAIEMTLAERLALLALVRLRRDRAAE